MKFQNLAVLFTTILLISGCPQPPPAQLCGDGICDDFEKANPDLCPQDCDNGDNGNGIPPPAVSDSDSPFGFMGPFVDERVTAQEISDAEIVSYLADIGTSYVRLIEPELNDEKLDLLNNAKIRIALGIAPHKALPPSHEFDEFLSDLKNTVRKYSNQIKVYLVVNEADITWEDTTENYAEYLIAVSEAIKSECTDCKVAMVLSGGSRSYDFLDSALKNGLEPYFDILDFHFNQHFAKLEDYVNLSTEISNYKEVFRKNGVEEKELWITEMTTYDGSPIPEDLYPYQSEKDMASGLVRRYVYGIVNGVEKIFWSRFTERHCFGGCPQRCDSYFDHAGLIHNMCNDNYDLTCPQNPECTGNSHKKLGYYSYKMMAEKLEGSDWDNIETVQKSDNIYAYKFTKEGKPVWVVWWDNWEEPNAKSKVVTLDVGNLNSVTITEAIPDAEDGSQINANDYPNFFNTEIKSVVNGEVEIQLREIPIFVE